MSKAMSPADWHARGEAYHEAAQHLGLAWTEDPKEREQAAIVAKVLERDADKCHAIADAADKLSTAHGFNSRPRPTTSADNA